MHMGQSYKKLSVTTTTTKMVSNKCPIIDKQIVIIFFSSLHLAAIATEKPVQNPFDIGFKCLQLKNKSRDPHF